VPAPARERGGRGEASAPGTCQPGQARDDREPGSGVSRGAPGFLAAVAAGSVAPSGTAAVGGAPSGAPSGTPSRAVTGATVESGAGSGAGSDGAYGSRAFSGSSRIRRTGEGSSHSTPSTQPTVAPHSVGRSPSVLPHRPAAIEPSGRIP
jgi:hypothetical protein